MTATRSRRQRLCIFSDYIAASVRNGRSRGPHLGRPKVKGSVYDGGWVVAAGVAGIGCTALPNAREVEAVKVGVHRHAAAHAVGVVEAHLLSCMQGCVTSFVQRPP
eukprot:scaffold80439_cov47-Prasinocladus_malaysianus.AAC.1